MFKIFAKKENVTKPFLVNDHGNYNFAELRKMPETQLVLLVPKRTWVRLAEYIQTFESITLAGRFGADPGDYEWEWIANPEAVRWWRRDVAGQESLFGMVLAVHRGELVELYGLVEVDETSPFWADVIPEEAANAMPEQAKLNARNNPKVEKEILLSLYRDFFRVKGMLTLEQPGQIAMRRGTVREVERLRDALRKLIERAGKASLPSELRNANQATPR